MNDPIATVIYHSADFDGIFCREIAKKFLPNATLIGWNHGDSHLEFPKEGTVYVLDLSPEVFWESPLRPEFIERLIWIDHHKTSIDKYPSSIPGYRIDGVAACRLAWQWLYALERFRSQGGELLEYFNETYPFPKKGNFVERGVNEPLAVRLAGEYDIWDRRDPNAELFQHGLRSCELTPEMWQELLRTVPEDGTPLQRDLINSRVLELLDNGRAVQYSKTQENAGIIQSYGFTLHWEGLTFLACNHARFNSHLFTAGLKPEHDACLGFNWDGRNSKWRVSLYHATGNEHHDLSLIAAKYGGGGHRGACGFAAEQLPFSLQPT